MKGYAAAEIFSACELQFLARAQRLVELAPHELDGKLVRCHELARAVGSVLDLVTVDGWYGMADHSWLCTTPPREFDTPPNILDVYAPGRLPQVQLVHSTTHLPFEYRRGDWRKDIRFDVIEELERRFNGEKPCLT